MGNKKPERKLDVKAWMQSNAFVRCKICLNPDVRATVNEIAAECDRIQSRFPMTAALALIEQHFGLVVSKETLRKHTTSCIKRGARGS